MSGLGLWVWTHYRGKQNITLRFITTYRPLITNSRGVQITYRQHQHYLDRTKDDRFPRQSMIEYLCTDIAQWRNLGDQIVLMLYLNENITSDTLTEIFSNVGLMEATTPRTSAKGLTFGAIMDTQVPHTVRRLNFQEPDTIKLVIELYKNFIKYNGLHSELFYLQERLVHEPLTTPLQTKYDILLTKS